MAQVSVNITDADQTAIHTVYEAVCKDAEVSVQNQSSESSCINNVDLSPPNKESIFMWYQIGRINTSRVGFKWPESLQMK